MLPQCSDLMKAMGWACRRVNAHVDAIYVSTPLTLPGGSPLDFYLSVDGSRLKFTDDGLTLFLLRNLGYRFEDRRQVHAIAKLAEPLGFTLTPNGEITALFETNQLVMWSGKVLRLFCKVIEWERAHFLSDAADEDLVQEIERVLKLKKPQLQLVRNAAFELGGGQQLHFNFKWGETYVDAVSPTARAVSFRLRKAVRFQRVDDEADRLLFVLDDRDALHKDDAKRELALLGRVARTVAFTEFARAA
jgi:hypothetical protein